MRVARDERFDEESVRYSLVRACEDCAHFDRGSERCAHEWPSEIHRRDFDDQGFVDFCKEFELW